MSVFIRAILIIYPFLHMAHSTGLSLSLRYHHAITTAFRPGAEATIYTLVRPFFFSFLACSSFPLALVPGRFNHFSLRLH
ncbi:hypothetical protein H4582DRAFT_2022115 [Lactarius indigo]|nr:hypothetical protein H4582DRAFT_2022115 [Lactarius indigo]